MLASLALMYFALAGNAGPADAQAVIADVTVFVGGYEVFGRLPTSEEGPQPTVTAQLRGPEGTLRATTQATPTLEGGVELAFTTGGARPRRAVPIRPGDRVILSVGEDADTAHSQSVEAPLLEATANPTTEQVAGHAPPAARVTVWATLADGSYDRRTVTADRSGEWTVDFSTTLNLDAGTTGQAYILDGNVAYQHSWAVRDMSVAIGSVAPSTHARPGEVVTATLHGPTGTVRARAEAVAWNGTATLWLHTKEGRSTAGRPGDRLTVGYSGMATAEPTVIEKTLPPLSIDIDPSANRVSGQTTPGATLHVTTAGAVRTVVADADGRWTLELDSAVDLTTDDAVDISWPAQPGVTLRARVPAVHEIDPLGWSVVLQGAAGTPASLALENADGQSLALGDGQIDADGRIRLTLSGPDGAMRPQQTGQTLTASVGDHTTTLAAAPLDVAVDAGTGEIEGTVRPGSTVGVRAGGQADETTADAAGAFALTLDTADLSPGSPVALEATAPNGTATALTFPVFRTVVQADGERVVIEGPPGLTASTEVEREGGVVADGACTVGRTSCTAVLRDEDGRAVFLQPGDLVWVLPETSTTAVVEVLPLSAHIDLSGRDVVGLAPPSSEVAITFYNDQGAPTPLNTTWSTDSTGVYDYELSASQWDLLVPGLQAEVRHTLRDGHQLMARAVIEVVRLTAGQATVGGLAEPGATVKAALRAAVGASAHASGETTADGDGRVALTLRDDGGAPVAPRAGDVLTVTHSRGGPTLTVPPLAAWHAPNGTPGTLLGHTASGARVRALHHLAAAPDGPALATIAANADDDGLFSLAAPPVSRTAVRTVEVVSYLPGDHELRLPVAEAQHGSRLYLPALRRP